MVSPGGMFVYGYNLNLPEDGPDHYAAVRDQIVYWTEYGGGFFKEFDDCLYLGYELSGELRPGKTVTIDEVVKMMTYGPGERHDHEEHMVDFYSQAAFSPELKQAIRTAKPGVFLIWGMM